MTTLIITEHPRVAAKLATVIKDTPDVFILATHAINVLQFQYPTHIKWNDLPYVMNIAFKRCNLDDCNNYKQNVGGSLTPTTLTTEDFNKFDTIIFACDPDHRGVMMFDTLIKQNLSNPNVSIKFLFLESLSEEYLEKAWTNQYEDTTGFMRNLNNARIKYYLDYNWNLNSHAILNKTLRSAGIDTTKTFSKYSLQLYYWMLKHMDYNWTETKLVMNLESWYGTGKYSEVQQISMGSPSSFAGIIQNLVDLKLIFKYKNNTYRLTDAGIKLSKRLHKDCCDLDLPFRIYEWSKLGFDDAQPLINRYLNTFFGKQKRYLNSTDIN